MQKLSYPQKLTTLKWLQRNYTFSICQGSYLEISLNTGTSELHSSIILFNFQLQLQATIMMKIVLIGFACCLGFVHGKRASTSTPRPPPPPPGAGSNVSKGIVDRESASAVSIPIFTGFKWVWCNGKWIKVTNKSCPAVFIDPDFSEHQCFCSTLGDLYGSYPGTSIWHFDTGAVPPSSPFKYCAHMPQCFCQACAKKTYALSSSFSKF